MKSLKVSLVVFVSLIMIGFVVGQQVSASSAGPGSSTDPIVTKSYVDKVVTEKAAQMQQKIDALKQEIEQLTITN